MKRIVLQIVCMMAGVLCSARTVTTFDFTKPDADNKLFGVELQSYGSGMYGRIGFATILEQQNIKISFTAITGSSDQRGPLFKLLSGEDVYHMELNPKYGVGGITFASANDELISEIKFEYFTNGSLKETTFKDWTLSTGVLDETNHDVWTGESQSVTFSMLDNTRGAARLKRIFITTTREGENSPEYNSVNSISEAVALGEGSYVKFSGALSCVSQSSDCKYTLVSDGTNVIYLYSPSAGVAALKIGEAVKPGISGKFCTIDGVPCLTIEYKTFGSQMQVQNQRVYLSELTDDYVGKVVKVYGGLINVDGDVQTLTQGETTIAIHGVTLNGFSTTTQNYVEVIGVIGKDGNNYVIQPFSVVASIYTADENITTDRPRVEIADGKIYIEGNWHTASVFDSEGRLVAKDRAVVDCSQGVFIVTADNRTIAKVLIR